MVLSEATVASHRVQFGWHAALPELRIGPAALSRVRPLAGNSLVAGESNRCFGDTFWRIASARSYTLNDEPGGCCPKPAGLPSSSRYQPA